MYAIKVYTKYLVTKSSSFVGHKTRVLSFLLCWLGMWLDASQLILLGDEQLLTTSIKSLSLLFPVMINIKLSSLQAHEKSMES